MADRAGPPRGVRGHLAQVGAPLALAALLAWRGSTAAAIGLVLFAAVLLVARVASRGRVDHAIARGAAAIGRALTAALLTAVFAVVMTPAWALRRLFGPTVVAHRTGWT